ncbi:FAD-dependent oxidoreductase [Granulicella sp. 5B5]|uniref:phytoene desaturase family protein n=1 Tax=Granulicella sp. 5B5 TaxID=1617967 RepID=UPI0015F5F923|nr:NAD(P)/FAD-dependent oxidoreductase [Granulicella sp. 5B5]QMV18648.1 FAD-dependent oxidoreductase [Granulicella sp. 5B5]
MALRTANIIGSGPNGLAAAITLAQRGVAVTVYERNDRIGGACSSAEITLPGFVHDLGSSAYPLGIASPFFRSLPLEQHGLRWVQPNAPVAHPLDNGEAVVLEPSLDRMGEQLSTHDAKAWRALFGPCVAHWDALLDDVMQPLLRLPSHPFITARFGLPALLSAATLASLLFRDERTKALFAGIAAHSVLPLTNIASASASMLLGTAGHASGWPIAAGGAQSLTNALAAYLRSLGGTIITGVEVRALSQLPPADATLFDTSATVMATIAHDALDAGYLRKLRAYRLGPGAFKIDYALSAPIPWKNPQCLRAATVHVGGTLAEIAASEDAAFYGHLSDKPYVLVVQPSLFDASRAPEGKHTAWAYCHVPSGSDMDRTAAIEAQIERFAPGFRDCVLARRASNASALTVWDPNLAGGDISGGALTLKQIVARPTLSAYRTSNPALYLCSAFTPPGGGVHGMCGHNAALEALRILNHPRDGSRVV